MAASIATTEPASIRAGDTALWTKALSDYSAADGYILTYYIVGPVNLSKAATTSGTTDFAVTLTATDTATLTPGDYAITGQVSLAGAVFTVYSARLTVLPNLASAAAGSETRSYWRKLRDDIQAAYAVFITDPTQAYTIMGERSVTLKTTAEFQRALAEAQGHVDAEDAAAGHGRNRNVYMKFRNAR